MAETSERQHARFRDALRHREFRLLLGSYAVSWTGDWCYSIALTVWVVQQTGSTAWVSLIFVLRILPYVLFGAPGGVIADRMDRRRLMVGLDVGRGVLMIPLILLVMVDGPVLVGAVIAFAANTLSAVYRPAVVASTPRVVGETDLAAANALETVVGQVTVFLGPALATLLLEITSPEFAFGFNAVTFAISALLVAGVRSAGGGRAASAPDSGPTVDDVAEPPAAGLRSELTTGWRALRDTPGLLIFSALLAGSLLAYGAEEVLKVLVASDNLGTGAQGVGLLGAAMGLGGLIIAPFTARLVGRSHLAGLFGGSVMLTGVAMALLALPRSLVPALAVAFVEGIALIVFEVATITLLQRAVAPDVLGRVYGLTDSVNAAATLAGAAMVPPLVALVGLDVTLAGFGLALAVGALFALPSLRPLDTATSQRAEELAPVVDVLTALAMFEGAPRAALERLAAVHTEERVAAGATVIHEGDDADDLFVIREGTFDVLSSAGTTDAAERINVMHAGDVFGEIGLVERMPRTATVVATTDALLWRIPGAVFLDALTGPALLPGAMVSTMATRLARTPQHRR
jgi:CRP-like cAMP-binding protein/predicted MFS family arabinose efflux permease